MVKKTSVKPGHPEKPGVGGHMGGVKATERLLSMIGLSPGQRALEIGCGSGYTACLVAGKGMFVVAMDIDANMLERAKSRAVKRSVAENVSFIQADAHNLPFKEGMFDAGLAESVLAYCDAGRVCEEAYRTLRPGGAFGANELTYLRQPDPVLKALLRRGFGISALLNREWIKLFEKTGFTSVISRTSSIYLTGQFLSQMKTDGLQKALTTAWHILNPSKASAKISRKVMAVAVKYRSYVGYGLYTGKKP